jgi:hypothetical protein
MRGGRPRHGVTNGRVALLSLQPPSLHVAGRVFTVPNPALLRNLKLGDRVTVSWHEAGAVLLAVSITPETWTLP